MRKEILIIGVVITAVLAIAIGITALYGGPPGVPGTFRGTDMGPGMMGPGWMGRGMGSGMMGGMGMMAIYSADAQPITGSVARTRAQAYADRYYPGATIGEFMEFSQNFYVELQDTSGAAIAEILVDRYTGAVTPEPGPNMVWNTQSRERTSGAAAYDLAGAEVQAGKFLAAYLPGAAIQDAITYPGYFTFDFGRGEDEGMLSVNAYTGEIWVHTWHGQFIGE
jgi:hypothetical protein